MRAVYSLWSAPRAMTADHRVCLSLSTLMARRHYDEVELVTDSPGARLAERLDLPVTSVRVLLDTLEEEIPSTTWAAGKLAAYAAQTEPFVHIDHDVFLFKRLPERVEKAAGVAQSPEPVTMYRRAMGVFPRALLDELVLPDDRWAAYNAGILGGTDVEFLVGYAEQALRIAARAGSIPPIGMTVLEQAFLGRRAADEGRKVECLLPSGDDAEAEEAGYCHLMNGKQCGECMLRVRRMLEREDNRRYTRAILAGG